MDECIDVLPPQQRTAERWYQGTADAIYQNIYTLQHDRPQVVLILGGDHIYKMDYGEMLAAHLERKADLTVACTEVPRTEATRFGVLGSMRACVFTGFKRSRPPRPLSQTIPTPRWPRWGFISSTPRSLCENSTAMRRTILDKGVKVPAGEVVGYDLEKDRQRFTVTESGVVVIPKGTVIGG
jgi:ADP-glucose pyrophosphorylase